MYKSSFSLLLAIFLCSHPAVAAPPDQAPGGGLPPSVQAPWTPHIAIPPHPDFANSSRVQSLIRAGNLYLSLSDALALAMENNLDIQLVRYALPIADADLLRAKGGGTLRGLSYILLEAPAGVGGPLSPVVTNPATATRTASGTSVTTNAVSLGALGGPQTNLTIQGNIAQANGTAVPNFDPAIVGQLNWTHQTTPQTNMVTTGTATAVTNTAIANAGLVQGFSTGAQVGFNYNNNRQNVNSLRTGYNPYTSSSLGLTVTQPLLRGYGRNLNQRFIQIAGNQRKITGLLFRQQLIATVYGVIRLYTDFLALYEDRKVKEESVATAEKLYSDVKEQVNEGTLAPVELTRANALVFTSRQDLINATGLQEEQEAILKNVLTRQGNGDPAVRPARIIPTDALSMPDKDEIRPMQDLIGEALDKRPDLGQAALQVENAQIGLKGTRNATLPQVDLVGVMQNNGLAGAANPLAASDGSFLGGYGSVLDQVFTRNYPTYGIGLQVTLPIHNRVAEADYARDQLQVRQQEVRLRQMQNQARLEVEDALIAMRRSRASYESAVQARLLQQESLEAEQAKFEVGASTSYFIIQYESMLAQAKSTEVAAKSAYVKARAALQRAMGTVLEENNVSFEDAYKARP